jgi:hypothetical protein
MANNQPDYLDEKRMIEHGVFIEMDDEELKGEIKIKLEPLNVVNAMRTIGPPFTFKRLVINYGFDPTDKYKGRSYKLRVYVSHADIFLNKVSKLAVWKNGGWDVRADRLTEDYNNTNPIWRGYFVISLKIGDPSIALGR